MTADGTRAWHADPAALRRWVEGRAGLQVGASVEAHLVHCAACRAAVVDLVDVPALEPVWDRVLADVQLPRPGLLERTLGRLGLSASEARLVALAPALRVAWLAALATVLAFAVVAASIVEWRGVTTFLVVAPLVPVLAVATAYGPEVDPSYEAAVATPYPLLRLVVLRTAAVLTSALPLVVLAGWLLPAAPVLAVAWLVPSAALVAAVLAASTWVEPLPAAVVAMVAWTAVVGLSAAGGRPLAVLDAAALLLYAALLVVASVVLVRRLRRTASDWPALPHPDRT